MRFTILYITVSRGEKAMTGERVYLQPKKYVLAAIHDMKELQNGKSNLADILGGNINYTVKMYHTKWEYQFFVTDVGMNRCTVKIEIAGDVKHKEDKILKAYALLDSILTVNTRVELDEKMK